MADVFVRRARGPDPEGKPMPKAVSARAKRGKLDYRICYGMLPLMLL